MQQRHPDTPEGFDFAIGHWQHITQELQKDGSYLPWPTASWHFWYILNGAAIQDEFFQPTPGGEVLHGTMIRAYDKATGKWHNQGKVAHKPGWDAYISEWQGDKMVMTGTTPFFSPDNEGIPIMQRVTFHTIQENTWKRDLDISFDDGTTWIKNAARTIATRATPESK